MAAPCLLLLGSLGGCSGFKAPLAPLFEKEQTHTSPAIAVVEGDFDDVDSAVYAASMAAETVEVRTTEPTPEQPDRWEYELLTVDGAPGTLRITRRPDGLIEMTCRIGRFGDPEREQHYVAAIAARLEELHGRAHAPIKDRTPPPPAILPPLTPRLPGGRP